jgi:protein phosphatase
MRYAARSDVGRIRSKNDDSAYVGRHLAVVADGMGGHAGGDIASASTVLDMIHLDHADYDGDAGTVLADEIQTANSLLSELVHINPKLAGMGTTVTALLLAQDQLHFAHIGDSRAYRLRDGEFEQVSIDHTFVQRLIDEGRLLPEEAESHPHKNVLMRVLGDVDASPELDLATIDVTPGERWLLCSDGLNYVAGHVVERVVRETKDLRECVELLVELTLEAGSPDNVTVVMVEIAEETPDDVNTAAVDVVPPPTPSSSDGTAAPKPTTGASPVVPGPPSGAAGFVPAEPRVDGKPAPAVPPTDSGAPSPADSGAKDSAGTKDPAAKDSAGDDGTNNGASEPTTTTDPHLGEHLSAEVLREELASRPHELVGAAATAAETGSIPTVAGRSVARRAATVLTHKAEQDRAEAELEETVPKRRRWITIGMAGILALLVVGGLWLGYAWTQTRFYIGEYDQKVAIYNGISQRLGPIQLSTLETVTNIRMESLPEFSQQRVRQTVPATDLYDAQRIVKNLETTGTTTSVACVTPSPAPSAESPVASAPAATSPASPAPESPGATAAASPVPTCEATQ